MVVPEPDDDGNQPTLKFINHHKMLQCPYVIYADTEALIKKIDGVKSHKPAGIHSMFLVVLVMLWCVLTE